MGIIIRLDRMMADRKISLNELAEKVGMTNVNLSNLKTGKMKGIRFETLEAICRVLDCQQRRSGKMLRLFHKNNERL